MFAFHISKKKFILQQLTFRLYELDLTYCPLSSLELGIRVLLSRNLLGYFYLCVVGKRENLSNNNNRHSCNWGNLTNGKLSDHILLQDNIWMVSLKAFCLTVPHKAMIVECGFTWDSASSNFRFFCTNLLHDQAPRSGYELLNNVAEQVHCAHVILSLFVHISINNEKKREQKPRHFENR